MTERFYGFAYTIKNDQIVLKKPYYYIYNDNKNIFIPKNINYLKELILYKKINIFSICKKDDKIFKIDFNCWANFLNEIYDNIENNLNIKLDLLQVFQKLLISLKLNYINNTIGIKFAEDKVDSICFYFKLTNNNSISNIDSSKILKDILNLKNIFFCFEKDACINLIALDFNFKTAEWKVKYYFRKMNNINKNLFYIDNLNTINKNILSSDEIKNNNLKLDYIQYSFNKEGLCSVNLCYSDSDNPNY